MLDMCRKDLITVTGQIVYRLTDAMCGKRRDLSMINHFGNRRLGDDGLSLAMTPFLRDSVVDLSCHLHLCTWIYWIV